jgi:signal transduction histidine kinase
MPSLPLTLAQDGAGRGGAVDEVEAPRLALWLVLGVLIATILGFVGSTWYARRIAAAVDADAVSIATDAAPAIEHLTAARGELVRIATMAASKDEGTLAAANARLRQELAAYAALPFYPREERRYVQAESAVDDLEAQIHGLPATRARMLEAAQRVDLAIEDLVDFNAQEQHRLALEIPRRRRLAHRVGSALQAISAVLGLVLMVLVIRAIREYGRLQASLYRQARAASRVRDDLLATVSHDLRNPVNAVRLTTQLMRRRLGDESVGVFTQRIDRAVDRVTRLIDDLLDAAKLEEGQLRVRLQPDDGVALIEATAEMFRVIAAEKGIELATSHPVASAPVACERHLILRVLGNLIANAIKFSESGSAILMTCEPEPERVKFSVVDHGPGIPADYVAHAFERYWQEGAADRRGSGLGLYIAKGIVEAHGGKIWIESVLGQGTTVCFVLPRLAPQ